jgi:hypothetical protein
LTPTYEEQGKIRRANLSITVQIAKRCTRTIPNTEKKREIGCTNDSVEIDVAKRSLALIEDTIGIRIGTFGLQLAGIQFAIRIAVIRRSVCTFTAIRDLVSVHIIQLTEENLPEVCLSIAVAIRAPLDDVRLKAEDACVVWNVIPRTGEIHACEVADSVPVVWFTLSPVRVFKRLSGHPTPTSQGLREVG